MAEESLAAGPKWVKAGGHKVKAVDGPATSPNKAGARGREAGGTKPCGGLTPRPGDVDFPRDWAVPGSGAQKGGGAGQEPRKQQVHLQVRGGWDQLKAQSFALLWILL